MTQSPSTIRLLALAFFGALIAGALSVTPHAKVLPAQPDPHPFLQAWLDTVQGRGTPDNACHPKTLADMFIACDKP
jgi:hypothetical protein